MRLSLKALCYLHAWDAGLPIENGLAFDSLLRKCRLDYSFASLGRIDVFLDAIRTAKKPREDTFLADPANQNLLYLLAFYAGEVIGRSLQCAPRWHTYDEIVALDAGNRLFGDGFYSSVSCSFPGSQAHIDFFMPLNAMVTRLFRGDGDKSIQFSAGLLVPSRYHKTVHSLQPLPEVPPPEWPIDIARSIERLGAQERVGLVVERPGWADSDALGRFFDHAPALLSKGRVVWGALIQANELLFQPGTVGGARGEVIYDAQGRLTGEDLQPIAKLLLSLKGAAPTDPALREFSSYLTDENACVFGMELPMSVAPYPLKVSTTWFSRSHLQGGTIALPWFPLLIDEEACPGIVMVLPSRFWPSELRAQWVAGSEGKVIVDPTKLVEEGSRHYHGRGVVRDQARGRSLWEQAAALGSDAAQLNLGKMHLRHDGPEPDMVKATQWLQKAAAQGNDAARQLLVDFELGGTESRGGGILDWIRKRLP